MRALALAVALFLGSVAMCAPPSAKASGLDFDVVPQRLQLIDQNVEVIDHAGPLRLPLIDEVVQPVNDVFFIVFPFDNHAAILPESIICSPSLRWDCSTMLAIAWRESRLDNTAVNPYSGAACWFQIMPFHGYDSRVLTSDPWACTFAAYDLFLESEYAPWRLN